MPKETRPMEITSLVQEICSLPVTEGKSVEEKKMSPSDDNPENENSVQEITDNSVPQPKSSKEQEKILPLVLDPHGKLLNLQVMKKSKTVVTEAAKHTVQPKISQPAASASQGVLVLSQGGKPVLNLGNIKIGKNVKLETSKVVD